MILIKRKTSEEAVARHRCGLRAGPDWQATQMAVAAPWGPFPWRIGAVPKGRILFTNVDFLKMIGNYPKSTGNRPVAHTTGLWMKREVLNCSLDSPID